MKKTLTWMTWLSLSAMSPIALAVGLGQASVSSYLNAPLNASLPLLGSSDYPLEEVRVSVADPADFSAAGLEWTPLAASIRIHVQEQQDGRQIRLISEQPMNEPWLELLLTIEHPGGREMQDVTLLFDPQGYAQPLPQTQSPATTQAQPTVVSRVNSDNNAGGRSNSAYIGSGDTLWGVAERIKPPAASVQQMMVALLEANPDVFPAGNINSMRAGQTLQVPVEARVLARSHSDANAVIQAMNEAWRERRDAPLQRVALPDVASANVSDVNVSETSASAAAIAAAQIVGGNSLPASSSTLTTGDAETLNTNRSALADANADDQAVSEESTAPSDALTLEEVTEQLRLSQATLLQMIEERELLRAEINALRSDVASLTQALNEAMAAQPPTPVPLAANVEENQSVGALLARYQWPLALLAIALLIALLVWLRQRREDNWQGVSVTEPVITPAGSPNVTPTPGAATGPQSAQQRDTELEQVPSSAWEPQASTAQPADKTHEPQAAVKTEAEQPSAQAIPPLDTDQWLVDEKAPAWKPTEQLTDEKGQASGQAALLPVSTNLAAPISLAPPSVVPMGQLLASLGAVDVADDKTVDEPLGRDAQQTSEAPLDAKHRFIDYHPPMLSGASSSDETEHTETLMQPTVEFLPQHHSVPIAAVKKPRRPVEEEWDIEEVAFTPRGLDNSGPSKSST